MMKYLQRLGKSLMLPVACLPVAAILQGIGYWIDPTGWGANNVIAAFLLKGGGCLIDQMPILFAIGVAVGMSDDNDGTAGLAGLVSWIMTTTLLSTSVVSMLTKTAEADVNAAFDRLASAMHMLDFVKGDKTALKAFIDKVSGLDSSKYTETTWTQFNDALTVANGVYEDVNAMQPEVNEAYTNLVTAFLNLRLIPDKSLLEDLINQANGLNSVNYTKASFDGLTKALNEAKVVFENPDATQEEVDNAKDVLAKAIAGLQTVTTDNTVKTPVDNGDTTASVKTGDESLTGMFATIALLSVAGYTVLRRKEN